MSRLAGPPTKRSIANSWRREVAHRRLMREYVQPEPMLAVPAARCRQTALLWAVGEVFENGLVIGRNGAPPYTRDMQHLVKTGDLRLFRRYGLGLGFNTLAITEKGRRRLARTPPDAVGLEYIANALRSSSLR